MSAPSSVASAHSFSIKLPSTRIRPVLASRLGAQVGRCNTDVGFSWASTGSPHNKTARAAVGSRLCFRKMLSELEFK